jgi:hypothetical protein
MSERHRRTSSIIQIRRDPSSAFDTVFTQTDTHPHFYSPYELYRTILTAMVSCYFCMRAAGRDVLYRWQQTWKFGFEIKVRSETAGVP